MAKLNSLRVALQKMLASFSQISTDKGLISWSSDNEFPEVDERIVVIDEEGNEAQAEDGEYRTDEGKIIVIVDGRVSEVRDIEEPENEPEPQEGEGEGEGGAEPSEPSEPAEPSEPEGEPQEPAAEPEPSAEPEPQPSAEDEKDRRIAELEDQVRNLEAEVARLEEENGALKERVAELENKPAAEPADAVFNRLNKIEKTGNKKIDRLIDIVNAK